MMLQSWSLQPTDRPTFTYIYNELLSTFSSVLTGDKMEAEVFEDNVDINIVVDAGGYAHEMTGENRDFPRRVNLTLVTASRVSYEVERTYDSQNEHHADETVYTAAEYEDEGE